VSPVTGLIDAFQWHTPVASLPSSDKGATIESSPFEEAMLAAPSPRRAIAANEGLAEPPREGEIEAIAPPAAQDNSPGEAKPAAKPAEPVVMPPPTAAPATSASAPVASAPVASTASAESPVPAAPLFRTRADLTRPARPIPAVIPIVRAPDDPGIDDEAPSDEFVEQIGTPKAQAGGWRGFLARWGG
jgi:HemY protein